MPLNFSGALAKGTNIVGRLHRYVQRTIILNH